MNIQQIANRLNDKAFEEGFKIAGLPELRRKYLGKRTLPSKIFTSKTIFPEYAFHFGGRREIQFNFGEEYIDEKQSTRFALCFSIEASQSLPNPVVDLNPLRKRFNQFIESHPDFFDGIEMWYSKNNQRYGNFLPQIIPDEWFQYGTFIAIGNIIKKPLRELNENDFAEILNGFDKLLPIYQFCVLQDSTLSLRLRIFTRLTSNENNWELPSPHKWRKEDQGKNNIPFENQYGFGNEEWLFNPRYNINGFQYGYIRGLDSSRQEISKYDEVHFYTIKKEKAKNLVYYLGYIKNVIPIKRDEKELVIIKEIEEKYNNDRINEVENINGDVKGITSFLFEAVAKFKIEDVKFLDEPIYQPNFDLEKYKRFQPYKLSSSIKEIFDDLKEKENSQFVSGKASQTEVYNRKNKESSITIEKFHSEIVDSLEIFLNPTYSLKTEDISIETMRFNGNIADIVTKEKDSSISIYEVKTSSSGRRNIRDAISQLLDYALHSGILRVNKIIIVSPSLLSKNEVAFLERLKAIINLPLEYLCYQKDSTPKFIKQ